MCFSVIAGKKATVDGSVLMGANNDWPGYPGHVCHVPGQEHGADDIFVLTNGLEIPQAAKTYAYLRTTTAYTTGTRAESWAEGINENQVAVSLMGVYAFQDKGAAGGLEVDDLSILVLERGKTARQSIEMIGELIKKYGFNVSSIEGAAGTAVMGIADPEEGFWLELAPGGHWVAKRVPDEMVSVRPNCFGIQEVDFSDPVNYLWSDDVVNYAREQGWYSDSQGQKFNFYLAYGADTAISVYGRASDPINAMRRWRTMNIASGQDYPLADLIYETIPQEKVSVRDVMDILRDNLEGTKHDLTSAPEAGIHGNPFWMEVSHSIGQAGTVLSMVYQLRRFLPNPIGGLAWFAMANSHLSVFLPCYLGSEGLPEEFQRGEILDFDPDRSAWWAFQDVGQECYRNFREIANGEVKPVFRAMEGRLLARQAAMEKAFLELLNQDPVLAGEAMADYTAGAALTAMDTARKLSRKIRGKYLANVTIV